VTEPGSPVPTRRAASLLLATLLLVPVGVVAQTVDLPAATAQAAELPEQEAEPGTREARGEQEVKQVSHTQLEVELLRQRNELLEEYLIRAQESQTREGQHWAHNHLRPPEREETRPLQPGVGLEGVLVCSRRGAAGSHSARDSVMAYNRTVL
jgi:hypothetical protein